MTFIVPVERYLKHYGILRKSGRYPYGSGGPEKSGNREFLGYVDDLRKDGLSDTEIARGMGISTTQFRAARTIAKNAEKAARISWATRLKDKGMSNVAIGEKMGIPESSVRSLLADGVKDRVDILQATATKLRERVDESGFIDVGIGVEHHLMISKEKLAAAVAQLQEEGYTVHSVQVDQFGTNKKTTVKVLAPPGTTYRDIASQTHLIQQVNAFSEDGGRSLLGLVDPLSISPDRIAIRYKEDGGATADGILYVRPGVDDLSLGGGRYAQVRVAVNGTHYLKGVALYKKDLPEGVDLVFNTSKAKADIGGDKLAAMKPLKIDKTTGKVDKDNPFGATIRRQILELDEKGNERTTSAMNIINEEGNWDLWSKNLSSQTLSKQSPGLAQKQLDITFSQKKADLDEIMALTNPAVKQKLLEDFADSADSSAIQLKAAALPRSTWHVLVPFNSLKENEIYAPNYNDGERVALIRYPHGGTFEIPELTVNNRHPAAIKAIGRAKDAVGINAEVASRLSGADFDGDAVLVIPNNRGAIKTTAPLEGLKNFDPQRTYPKYDGMVVMDDVTKGFEMGDVSNLITDMTIKKAPASELTRAVRHSMVVIDAAKHELNWKQSAIDNGIPQLKAKYQYDPSNPRSRGAATLISRATSRTDVNARKPRSAKLGGPVDPATGKKIFEDTNENWVNNQGKTIWKKQRSVKLAETDDAHTLSSGTPIEKVYADHSNRLKALANQARREAVNTKTIPYSPSAKKVHNAQVQTLNAKLTKAQKNAPLERQAQIIANRTLAMKRQANPHMTSDEIKKAKFQALKEARFRMDAKKDAIHIEDSEWKAIQEGAITHHKLTEIMRHANMDRVKELATPRATVLMTSTKLARAKAMADGDYTQAEIAAALGVSLTTLKRGLSGD